MYTTVLVVSLLMSRMERCPLYKKACLEDDNLNKGGRTTEENWRSRLFDACSMLVGTMLESGKKIVVEKKGPRHDVSIPGPGDAPRERADISGGTSTPRVYRTVSPF